MEIDISNKDAAEIGIDSATKERIVDLVHVHLGRASVVTVRFIAGDLPGISLETVSGRIVVDRNLTQ